MAYIYHMEGYVQSVVVLPGQRIRVNAFFHGAPDCEVHLLNMKLPGRKQARRAPSEGGEMLLENPDKVPLIQAFRAYNNQLPNQALEGKYISFSNNSAGQPRTEIAFGPPNFQDVVLVLEYLNS